MKIIYIIDTLKRGGKEKQLTELVKQLHKNHSILIISFNEIIEYDEITRLPTKLKIINSKKKSFSTIIKIYNICKNFSPDIIHTWDLISSILAIPSAKLLNIKLINGSLRGSAKRTFFSKYKILANITFLFSEKVISNSYAGLNSLNKFEDKKFIVIHNGFDFSVIKNLPSEKEIRNKLNVHTPFIVGMVSSFREGKDYGTFFKAAEHILNKRNDITFISVGKGKQYNYYYNKYGNFRNILFLGKQSDIEPIVKIFTIGVLLSVTSKNHGEGISNSIMEYMACSKPVITTNSGGNNEIVIHNKTGFVIPQKDIFSFEKYIIYLLENYDIRKRFGKEGKILLYRNYNINFIKDKFLKSYID